MITVGMYYDVLPGKENEFEENSRPWPTPWKDRPDTCRAFYISR